MAAFIRHFQACKLKFRLRGLISCLYCVLIAMPSSKQRAEAAAEHGSELSQPKFVFTRLGHFTPAVIGEVAKLSWIERLSNRCQCNHQWIGQLKIARRGAVVPG